MARIRTLKPEFWTDEKLALMPPLTRLVFLGLISQADDAGRLVDNVKLLDGMLFPYTDDTCREALDELSKMGRVIRYRSDSGQPLLQVANWEKHQKVQKPSKYTLPAPSEERVQESSGDSPETPRRSPVSDLRPTTPDLLPTTDEPREGNGGHRAACVDFVQQNGYGAKERLIAEGEDGSAWATNTGDRVPWPDRLRMLKLAHARVEDGENKTLRSALRYVIPQQTDPFRSPSSDAPKPGTEAAAVRSESPQQHRTNSTSDDFDRAKREREEKQQGAYTEWRQQMMFRLNGEDESVRNELLKQVNTLIGDTLRMMPENIRTKTAEAKLLELYGERIGEPQPSIAA